MSDMFKKDENNITTAWKYYELGRTYNNSLSPSQYTVVNTNIEFFTGNQWRNLPQTRAMAALPKPPSTVSSPPLCRRAKWCTSLCTRWLVPVNQ